MLGGRKWRDYRVWKDNWVLGGDSNKITSDMGHYFLECTIKEFMNSDSQGWNVPLIRQVFNETDAARILCMSFSNRRSDVLAWKHQKNGIYLVKFGYIELRKESRSTHLEVSEDEARKWRWVWKLAVTPKVQLFTWRILQGIIPTNVNLITRFINVPPECKR